MTNVECGRRGTGVGDRLGNKGGVVVTLRLHDTSLAFVASHLEAFQHSVGGRNADFAAIAGGVPLGKKGADLLSQFDHVFWCGDLNYRIDLPRPKVLALVQASDWAGLRDFDQLTAERLARRAFGGFVEGPVAFCPTYRYLKGAPPDARTGRRATTPRRAASPRGATAFRRSAPELGAT